MQFKDYDDFVEQFTDAVLAAAKEHYDVNIKNFTHDEVAHQILFEYQQRTRHQKIASQIIGIGNTWNDDAEVIDHVNRKLHTYVASLKEY